MLASVYMRLANYSSIPHIIPGPAGDSSAMVSPDFETVNS